MVTKIKSVLSEYASRLQQWAEPYFTNKQTIHTTERCAIRITPNHLKILHVDKKNNQTKIIAQDSVKYDTHESLTHALRHFIKTYQLEEVPFNWILEPKQYHLFLIESMPVEKSELRDALTWRIRSLITYPIEDALIDYFLLPPKKNSPGASFVAGITANSNVLAETINIFKHEKLILNSIYIPELALRNLAELYENDERSTAIIYLYDNIALLSITRNKMLYFTRQIPLESTSELDEASISVLSLEIQRYFDYYQSNWRYPTPNRILFASDSPKSDALMTLFTEKLMSTIEHYKLPPDFASAEENLTIQASYLLNLGCAMQQESSHE